MVLIDDVSATLEKLDTLCDTLEQGMQSYENYVGVLRGQVQTLGARLTRYAAGNAIANEVAPEIATDEQLTLLKQLVSKVTGRFNNVLRWRSNASASRQSPVSTPTKKSPSAGSSGTKNEMQNNTSKSEETDSAAKAAPSTTTDAVPPAKENDGDGDGDGDGLTYEMQMAENERTLQAKLLLLDPDEMWAEIAHMWTKINWARMVFRNVPAEKVLEIAKQHRLGPPPSGVAKALFSQPGAQQQAADPAALPTTSSIEEKLNRCSTASAFETVLLSLQPDEMWEHVGAVYRELQWSTAVVSNLPGRVLKQAVSHVWQNADGRTYLIGPPPPNFFFPEVATKSPDGAPGSPTVPEGEQSVQLVGESFQGMSEGSENGQHTPTAASMASAQEDEQEIDVGIAVADDLSVGNCFVLREFMRAYQHLPEYQLHCLKVMRSLVETPLPGVSGGSHTSLPSALADQDANSTNASSPSGEKKSGLARALAHPESWVCSTCTYRNRGPRKTSDSATGAAAAAAAAATGQGPPPMPMAWLRGEIEKPAGEKDWGPGQPKSLFYTREQQLRLSVDENGNHVDDPTEEEHAESNGSMSTCECELCGVEFYLSEVEIEQVSVEDFEVTVSDRPMQQRLVRLDCINLVLHALRTYPHNRGIQRQGCLALLQLSANSTDADAVVRIAAEGGIQCVLETMQYMLKDVTTQLAAFGLLASPVLIDSMVTRIGMAEYISAVMAAMKAHPKNPQIQGLGYLALANLALRDDRHVGDIVISGGIEVILDSLSHMEEEANVQAAGFWVLSALTRPVADGAHSEAREVVQQSGRTGSFLKAVRRFPKHKKLREHAERLIDNLLDKDEDSSRRSRGTKQQQHWAALAGGGSASSTVLDHPDLVRRGGDGEHGSDGNCMIQ